MDISIFGGWLVILLGLLMIKQSTHGKLQCNVFSAMIAAAIFVGILIGFHYLLLMFEQQVSEFLLLPIFLFKIIGLIPTVAVITLLLGKILIPYFKIKALDITACSAYLTGWIIYSLMLVTIFKMFGFLFIGLVFIDGILNEMLKVKPKSNRTSIKDKLENLVVNALILANPRNWNKVQLLHTISGHSYWINSVAISPDGKMIVSCGGDHTIKIWNLHTGELVHTISKHSDSVTSVAISPDGQTLVTNDDNCKIRVWNLYTGELLHTLNGHWKWVTCLAISPDGHLIISGSEDKTIKIWNLYTGQLLHTLVGFSISTEYSGGVESIAISPDGQTLISSSEDKTVKIWNLHTGQLQRILDIEANTVAISPSGQIFVTGSYSRRQWAINIWDLNTGGLLHSIKKASRVTCAVISPDGQTIISGDFNNRIKIWNLFSGKLQHTINQHDFHVTTVAISPDGQTLVSGSRDQIIKIWHLSGNKLIHSK